MSRTSSWRFWKVQEEEVEGVGEERDEVVGEPEGGGFGCEEHGKAWWDGSAMALLVVSDDTRDLVKAVVSLLLRCWGTCSAVLL